MKLKICGMKYPENIVEVGSLLHDYMGFIFWEKSARYFDGILPELPKSIKKTGVFVNETIPIILEKTAKYDLQAIQLHGHESAEFCSELKTKLEDSIEIIKVFSADENFDFSVLEPFEAVCDYFGTTFENIRKRNRRRTTVLPRQVCMFLLSRYTELSLREIGLIFGTYDHTTVIHSRMTVQDLMDSDVAFRLGIQSIELKIQ